MNVVFLGLFYLSCHPVSQVPLLFETATFLREALLKGDFFFQFLVLQLCLLGLFGCCGLWFCLHILHPTDATCSNIKQHFRPNEDYCLDIRGKWKFFVPFFFYYYFKSLSLHWERETNPLCERSSAVPGPLLLPSSGLAFLFGCLCCGQRYFDKHSP